MPAQDKMAGVYADDVECACQEGAKNEGTRPTDRHNFFVDAVDIFDEICNKKKHRYSQSHQEEAYTLVLKWACLKTLK